MYTFAHWNRAYNNLNKKNDNTSQNKLQTY